MEKTIQDLVEILLKAVPTLLLFAVLFVYLKFMFFTPLQKVLAKRREATEGARETAEAGLESAALRTAEYEAKIRDARAEIYKEQEQMRRRWLGQQAAFILETRAQAQAGVAVARRQIEADIAVAKQDLAGTSNVLAGQIFDALLRRRAS